MIHENNTKGFVFFLTVFKYFSDTESSNIKMWRYIVAFERCDLDIIDQIAHESLKKKEGKILGKKEHKKIL